MIKKVLIITSIFFNFLGFAQKVDFEKVEKIGGILCDCLEENKLKSNEERVDICVNVLSKGLSIIKSDSIRNIYAQKADTFLQKNCLAYIEMLIKENSDILISNYDEFSFYEKKKVLIRNELIEQEYYYKDFIGDIIFVKFDKNKMIERSKLSELKTFFNIRSNLSNLQLVFEKSEDDFFNDYYQNKEVIDFFISKENNLDFFLFLKYSNGVILRKMIHKVK